MRKKNLVAAAGLLGVAVVGGTLAYFNQTLEAENKFETGTYGTELVEEFTPPPTDWEPGAKMNKDVYVTNTGDMPVVVRVKFEEEWKRGDATFKKNDSMVTVQEPSQGNPNDGYVSPDGTVVKKIFESENWEYDTKTGWYYYTSKIAPGAATTKLLDGVQLISDVDMGDFNKVKYYTTISKDKVDFRNGKVYLKGTETELGNAKDNKPENGWVRYDEEAVPAGSTFNKSVTEIKDGAKGYSDADYTLKVTAITCQATTDAVEAIFADAPTDLVTNWNLLDPNADPTTTTPSEGADTDASTEAVTEITEQ